MPPISYKYDIFYVFICMIIYDLLPQNERKVARLHTEI